MKLDKETIVKQRFWFLLGSFVPLALIVWTLVMCMWLYAVRIPAIGKAGIDPAKAQEPTSLAALPLRVDEHGAIRIDDVAL